eukprot:s637_g7.t1
MAHTQSYGNCLGFAESKLASKPYLESLSIAVSKSQDPVLVDYLMQFFHNIVKLDGKSGSMLMACGFHRHIFNYERLESLSVVSAIYLCDLCRQVANTDAVVRATLLEEMIFSVLTDAWVVYVETWMTGRRWGKRIDFRFVDCKFRHLSCSDVNALRGAVDASMAPHSGDTPVQHSEALVIGIDRYDDPVFSDLNQCVHDADLVESCLLEGQFCSQEALVSLRDPPRDDMFDALDSIAKRTHACLSCLLLLYYAGHSYEDDGMVFMCPSNSKRREDDISLESFIQRLSDQTTLVCIFASCQAKLDLLTKEPVFRPSVAFPKQWHTRATARLRDVLGRSVRCRMFMFFGCHPGKELPDDGFFTATLIKYMKQRALDVHDMARAVTQEVCQATQHRQWPLIISNLDQPLCLLPAELCAIKKVDARGLMDNLEVQRYVGAVRMVTRDGDPDTVDFNWACKWLCGLPKAARHYRGAQPLRVLQICDESRIAIQSISDDDRRAATVPALLLLSYLDELEARLMIVRGECEPSLPSSASQVARLEYGRCLAAIASFLDTFEFDDFVAAKALLLLQL